MSEINRLNEVKDSNGLNRLTDKELIVRTEGLAREERELLAKVLHHLREIDRRKLFSALGYKSLFEFATRKLGYSEAQACRRIDAMRLLRELPELEKKVTEGTLNLTHLGMAQNLFRAEKKLDREVPKSLKLEIFEKITSKPVRETEGLLLSYSSNPQTLSPDRVRAVSEERVELKFTASKDLLQKIETLKGYLAHTDPNISLGELVDKLCDLGMTHLAPSKKGSKFERTQVILKSPSAPKKACVKMAKEGQEVQEAKEKREPLSLENYLEENAKLRGKYIPRPIRRRLFLTAQNQCQVCQSTFALEIDHVHPRALGGTNDPRNLRVLCRNCNQRQSIEKLEPRST